VSPALAILVGANPNRRLRTMARPSRLIGDQAEATIADGEGLGVVFPHLYSLPPVR